MFMLSKWFFGFLLAVSLASAACGGATSNVSPTPEPSVSEQAVSPTTDGAAALASLQLSLIHI